MAALQGLAELLVLKMQEMELLHWAVPAAWPPLAVGVQIVRVVHQQRADQPLWLMVLHG
jgi:hypothetical protein